MPASKPPAPRYISLARDIAEEIANGVHPVGTRLPTELEMSVDRGVSRSTVRAALLRLEDLGLVSRRRRSGTHVTATSTRPDATGYVQSLASVEDLLQYASGTERRVLQVVSRTLDKQLALELNLPADSKWVIIQSLRVSLTPHTLPLSWAENYVEASCATPELIHKLHTGNQSLIASLVAESTGRPIEEIHQSITATGIGEGEMAKWLQCEPGEHALRITRRYCDKSGQPLAITINYSPANRFRYDTRLRRNRPQTEA